MRSARINGRGERRAAAWAAYGFVGMGRDFTGTEMDQMDDKTTKERELS